MRRTRASFSAVLALSVLLGSCAEQRAASWEHQNSAQHSLTRSACKGHEPPAPQDVKLFRVIHRVQPIPPLGPERSGWACISVTIDEAGQPLDPQVVATNNRGFADAFVTAVRRWRFAPATRDGVPIRYPTVLSASFMR